MFLFQLQYGEKKSPLIEQWMKEKVEKRKTELPPAVKNNLSDEYVYAAVAYIFKNTLGEATGNSLNALGTILSNPKYAKDDAETLFSAAKAKLGNALCQQLILLNNEISGRAGAREENAFLRTEELSDSRVDEVLKKLEPLIYFEGDLNKERKYNSKLPTPTSEDLDVLVWGARFHSNTDMRVNCAYFFLNDIYRTPEFKDIPPEYKRNKWNEEKYIETVGREPTGAFINPIKESHITSIISGLAADEYQDKYGYAQYELSRAFERMLVGGLAGREALKKMAPGAGIPFTKAHKAALCNILSEDAPRMADASQIRVGTDEHICTALARMALSAPEYFTSSDLDLFSSLLLIIKPSPAENRPPNYPFAAIAGVFNTLSESRPKLFASTHVDALINFLVPRFKAGEFDFNHPCPAEMSALRTLRNLRDARPEFAQKCRQALAELGETNP